MSRHALVRPRPKRAPVVSLLVRMLENIERVSAFNVEQNVLESDATLSQHMCALGAHIVSGSMSSILYLPGARPEFGRSCA
jgi:hypothetical protein